MLLVALIASKLDAESLSKVECQAFFVLRLQFQVAADYEFEPIDGRLPRLYDGPYFNAEGGGRMLAPSQLDVDLEMHQVLMAEVRAGSTRISPATRARVLKRDKELRLEVCWVSPKDCVIKMERHLFPVYGEANCGFQ